MLKRRKPQVDNTAAMVTGLAGARIALGVGAWLAPAPTARLFGVQTSGNHEAILMARLFGARDAALGIGTLQATGQTRRMLLALGLGCDVLDAAAGLLTLRAPRIPTSGALLATAVATSAAVVGARALAQQ